LRDVTPRKENIWKGKNCMFTEGFMKTMYQDNTMEGSIFKEQRKIKQLELMKFKVNTRKEKQIEFEKKKNIV
jgi:hypothetical protein